MVVGPFEKELGKLLLMPPVMFQEFFLKESSLSFNYGFLARELTKSGNRARDQNF